MKFFRTNDYLGELSNYFESEINYNNLTFPTAEHLYHALRFIYEGAPEINNHVVQTIISTKSPYRVQLLSDWIKSPPEFDKIESWQKSLLRKARLYRNSGAIINPNFDRLETMRNVLDLKYRNNFCKDSLVSTGDNNLQFSHCSDRFWGSKGENHLGMLLMQLRSRLRG